MAPHKTAPVPGEMRSEWLGIAAACGFCAAGWGFYLALPVVLGAIAGHFGYSAQQIGWLGSVELTGMLLGGLLAAALIGRGRRRILATVGIGIVAGSLVGIWLFDTFMMICLFRLAGGLGAGMAYSTCVACLASTSMPTRSFGMLNATMVLAGALHLAVFPWFDSSFGLNGILFTLMAECVVAFVLLPYLPCEPGAVCPAPTATAMHGTFAPRRCHAVTGAGAAFITGTVLFHIAPAGFWAYCARLASDNGLSTATTGNVLMIGNLASAGACLVAWRASRLWGDRRALLFSGCALAIVLLSWAAPMAGLFGYALRTMLFFLAWGVAGVFQQSQARTFDSTGRMMTVIPVAQNLGLAIGPFIGASILGWGFDVMQMLAIAAASTVASLFLYLYVRVPDHTYNAASPMKARESA